MVGVHYTSYHVKLFRFLYDGWHGYLRSFSFYPSHSYQYLSEYLLYAYVVDRT